MQKTRDRKTKVEKIEDVKKVTEEKYSKPTYLKEKKVEKEVKVEKVEVKKVEIRKGPERFVATYIGPQNNIRISPHIGRIMRGVPFKVDKNIAQTLKFDSNFKVERV